MFNGTRFKENGSLTFFGPNFTALVAEVGGTPDLPSRSGDVPLAEVGLLGTNHALPFAEMSIGEQVSHFVWD